MAFESNFPVIIYETEEGVYDAYAPPIPPTIDGVPITEADIVKVGSYPDKVVKSLVVERDRKGQELYNSKLNEETMWKRMYHSEEELKQQKVTTKEQMRLQYLWKGKCAMMEVARAESNANNSSEEVGEEDHAELPNGDVY